MKNILKTILLICSVFACLGISSCSSPDIVGTWKVSEYNPKKPMDEETKKEIFESTLSNCVLELKADQSFSQTVNGVTQKGKWELLGENRQLKLTVEGGSIVIINLESLSGTTMVQATDDGTITFKKQ
ncbi:MAG: lipocalin family protein [Bacteroidales bacterium]|jgi:hypothetical protein|nr:lipocalin family protein [Bacteroidales bacterium]MBR6277901.1 lipocalin family protein [Bacteroidales bacterium]